MKHTFNFLLIIVFCFSCNFEKNSLSDFLNEFDKNINDYEKVVFINLDTCSSCYDLVSNFMSNQTDREDLLVVLTSSSSKKMNLVLEKGKPLNLILDSEMKSVYQDLITLQPVVYQIDPSDIYRKDILLTDLIHE